MSGAVAVLHPGAMGSRVAGEIASRGGEVRWLRAHRSAESAERARREGLTPVDTADELVRGAHVVLSICPPQGALDVARLVAEAGFAGTYVDANPVSPEVLENIATLVETAGASFVDAGIVGPPPGAARRTHLYLAGPPAAVAAVTDLCAGTAITPLDLGTRVGAASAAKQSYALFNKGRLAVALAAADLAAAYGVTEVLAAEGDRPGAETLRDLDGLRRGLAQTAWRWGPEFDEIAATLAAAGLDPSLARSVAVLYDGLAAPNEE